MAQVYNKGDLHLFHVMAKVTEDQIGLLRNINIRCGRVMADNIAYAKFRKTLLI